MNQSRTPEEHLTTCQSRFPGVTLLKPKPLNSKPPSRTPNPSKLSPLPKPKNDGPQTQVSATLSGIRMRQASSWEGPGVKGLGFWDA